MSTQSSPSECASPSAVTSAAGSLPEDTPLAKKAQIEDHPPALAGGSGSRIPFDNLSFLEAVDIFQAHGVEMLELDTLTFKDLYAEILVLLAQGFLGIHAAAREHYELMVKLSQAEKTVSSLLDERRSLTSNLTALRNENQKLTTEGIVKDQVIASAIVVTKAEKDACYQELTALCNENHKLTTEGIVKDQAFASAIVAIKAEKDACYQELTALRDVNQRLTTELANSEIVKDQAIASAIVTAKAEKDVCYQEILNSIKAKWDKKMLVSMSESRAQQYGNNLILINQILHNQVMHNQVDLEAERAIVNDKLAAEQVVFEELDVSDLVLDKLGSACAVVEPILEVESGVAETVGEPTKSMEEGLVVVGGSSGLLNTVDS